MGPGAKGAGLLSGVPAGQKSGPAASAADRPVPPEFDNMLDSRQLWHHDARMRTTLTLDPDVATKAKNGAAKLGKPFKEVVNAALRIGLDAVLNPPPAKPYRTKPRPMGLRRGLSYDNIGELLARAEGEDHQ
jgi:hypothetical protein